MAIAYDTATDGNYTSGTTHTFSHTVTGSNTILFVLSFHNSASDLQTGVTYNGVSMTLIDKQTSDSGRYGYMWYLINPATGANNIVITASSSTAIGGNAVSYTGALQSGVPDASTKQILSTTTIDTTLTTVLDNCWTVLTVVGSRPPTASTGSTERVANTTYSESKMFDSNGAITPAGSTTMRVTTGSNGPNGYIMASFAPSTGGATNEVKSIAGVSNIS